MVARGIVKWGHNGVASGHWAFLCQGRDIEGNGACTVPLNQSRPSPSMSWLECLNISFKGLYLISPRPISCLQEVYIQGGK